MTNEPRLPPRVQFGPFELDVASGELCKHGLRLRLTGQSLQILEVLLERPNQVVAREELQHRLWNGTTFVDFNQGLNAAVNRLRQTLGDSADQPRYVETVPGKGYRFIAPIVHVSTTVSSPPAGPPVALAPDTVIGGPGLSADDDVPAVRPRSFWTQLPYGRVALALILGTALAVGAWHFAGPARSPTEVASFVTQPIRFQVGIPEGIELSPLQLFSLSPDGKNLAYFARKTGGGPFVLWVQSLASVLPTPLPVHHGMLAVFWSPDSRFFAYASDGRLKKADLTGTPAQEMWPVPFTMVGAAWATDGTVIVGTETKAIVRLDATTGDLFPVTVRDVATERAHIFPAFLPDGKHFLYSRMSTNGAKNGVYVGSLDVKPEDQSRTPVVATSFAARFVESADGHGVILFQRETTLWAQRFDTSRLLVTGEPQIVAERLGHTHAHGFFAASSGVLIHRSGTTSIGRLTWFDRHGRSLGTVGAAFNSFDVPPNISPDGSKIALTQFGAENTDIWVHDLSRDVTQRLTFDPAIDQFPIWSPDGKRLVFSSARNGRYDLYQVRSDGDGGPELLYASNDNKYASAWSADGRFILFSTEKRDGIWVLPLEGAGKHIAVSLLQSPANERSGVFSPDSRWIAYVSNESGQSEVYIQRFLFPFAGSPVGPKVLISRGGGTNPHWRADGKEVFYRASDGTLMSVSLTTDSSLRPGVPTSLFRSSGLWDVTGDGSRFLVSLPVEQGAAPFCVVLNWQAGLKN